MPWKELVTSAIVVQGVLQSLTSTVGSAASTVTSGARSAVSRLTGEQPSNNGFSSTPNPMVSDPFAVLSSTVRSSFVLYCVTLVGTCQPGLGACGASLSLPGRLVLRNLSSIYCATSVAVERHSNNGVSLLGLCSIAL